MKVIQGYYEKLKDPRWQKKRLKVLERDEWACQSCYNSENTLNVHHKYYIKDRDPWDYPMELLITLCEPCHEIERTMMGEVMPTLVMAAKTHFLSYDIHQITTGFVNLKLQHNSEVVASMLQWVLETPKLQSELIDSYFKHLPKSIEEKSKNGKPSK